MNRPSKKTSAKIIVDEYERFCQGHELPKKVRISEHLKEDHYHKYIDQEFIQKPLHFNSHHEEKFIQEYHDNNTFSNNMRNDNFYDLMSQSDDQSFNMFMQRPQRHHKEVKGKMKSNLFPLKREETQVKNRINKDSDYFPQEHVMKSHLTSTFNKAKRPLSSMAKKNQGPSNSRQQKQSALKKTHSTSKFKEDHRKVNTSSQKEKVRPNQSSHIRNNQTFKSNIAMRKQLNSQYQDPLISKLKKKNVTLASKPLKIQQIPSQNKNNKMHSSQHIADRIYFKKEQQKAAGTPRTNNRVIKIEKKESNIMKQSIRKERQMSEISETEHHRVRNHGNNIRRQPFLFEQEREKIQPMRRRQNIRPQHHHQHRQRQREQVRQPRREREQQRRPQQRQPPRRQRQQREPQPQPRARPQHRNREQPRRNNRNPRYQSNSRNSPNPGNFFNFVSHTINQQMELMNNQFNMMSNMFENFSNFVNINIDTRGDHFHFGSQIQSSDQYNTDGSSQSWDSDAEDYSYDAGSEEQGGLNSEQLERIRKIRYRTNQHGSNQCTICLIQLKTGDEAKKLFCEHMFHSDCIDEWLKRKSDCPVCRDKQ